MHLQLQKNNLEKQGIEVLTSTKLLEIVDKGHEVVVKVEGKEDIVVDKVLLSIGRVPDNTCLGELADKFKNGNVDVLKLTNTWKLLLKEFTLLEILTELKCQLTQHSRWEEIAAENAMGHHKKVDLKSTPAAIYTHPEIAMVGLTEEQARENMTSKLVNSTLQLTDVHQHLTTEKDSLK